MSRRTKLIILAIFAVLLGIPTAYLALAWHPANPLRFRLLYAFPDVELREGAKLLRVRIENTSITPVQLEHALIDPNPAYIIGGAGDIKPTMQFDGEKLQFHGELTIPPSGVAELNAILNADRVDAAMQGSLNVRYLWRSQLQMKENTIRDWIHEHISFFRQERSKYVPPHYSDVTLLKGATE